MKIKPLPMNRERREWEDNMTTLHWICGIAPTIVAICCLFWWRANIGEGTWIYAIYCFMFVGANWLGLIYFA